MSGEQNASPRWGASRLRQPGAGLGAVAKYSLCVAALGGLSLVAGFEVARKSLPVPAALEKSQAANEDQRISPVRLPATENAVEAEISRLAPQQQVEHLLARATGNDEASLKVLHEKVDGLRGKLKSTDRLFDLVLAALNSHDLRVRTAAVEVDLAANNLSKSPESVSQLLGELRRDPAARGLALWRLGSLGNRGVEPEKVLENLLRYAHDPSEHTRYWAVEGLAMLGSDATLTPLLDRLAHDSSPRVRERAACSLAQSGMLTFHERWAAVPHLLNLADDDSLSTTTRELVYGTLRVITGAAVGNDVNAWRAWWAHHDQAQEKPRKRSNLLKA